MNTVDRARGRWREILPQLGVEIRFLVNKHGPCPMCGGRDRFRFDDLDGSGSYYCNQCGAGTGVILIRKLHGWDHATACAEIDKMIGADRGVVRTAKTTTARPDDGASRRRAQIERLIAEARATHVVRDYLSRRGIVAISPALRGHPRCPYFDDDTRKLVGRFPAVIAPIIGPDGELQSVQRIYIADIDPRKKPLPPVSTIKGAAIRLFDPENGMLGIAEGVETALAAHTLFRVPVWSVLSERGMQAFDPPVEIHKLLVFADNDRNHVGQAAAYNLARRLSRDHKEIEVVVHVPAVDGTDFNDVLKAQTAR